MVGKHLTDMQLGLLSPSCCSLGFHIVLFGRLLQPATAPKHSMQTSLHAGWDVFILWYDVKEPLSSVITGQAMSGYLRLFRLLWTLKRGGAYPEQGVAGHERHSAPADHHPGPYQSVWTALPW